MSPPEPSSCFWMLPFLHHFLSHLPATLRGRPRPTNTPTPPRLAAQRSPGVAPHTPCPTPAIGCGMSAPCEGSEIVRVDTKCDMQETLMAMGLCRGDAPADRARGTPSAERSCPSGSIESLRPRDPRVFSLKLPTWSPTGERVRPRADCLRRGDALGLVLTALEGGNALGFVLAALEGGNALGFVLTALGSALSALGERRSGGAGDQHLLYPPGACPSSSK